VFVDRIATIDDEIRRFENAMGDACLSITKDMRRFLHRVNQTKQNLPKFKKAYKKQLSKMKARN